MLELGRRVFELKIKIIRKQVEIAVVAHKAAIHTAIVRVTDTVETRRIGNWQHLQKNRVDKSEYRGVRSDTERDGEDHGGGKTR